MTGLKLVHSVRELPPLPEPTPEDVAVLEARQVEGMAPEAQEIDALIAAAAELEGRLAPGAAGRIADRRARLERVRAIHDAHRRRELGALRLPVLIEEARETLDDGWSLLRWLVEGGEPPSEETMARLRAPRADDPRERLVRSAAAQLGEAVRFERHELAREEWLRGERDVLVLDGDDADDGDSIR